MSAIVRFACHRCGKALRAPNGLVGKSARCPACTSAVVVRSVETSASKAGFALPTAAVASSSRLLSVLESLIGPVPNGLAATAQWQLSQNHRSRLIGSFFGFFGQERTKVQRAGCIAVKSQFLHLLDFGCKTAGVQIDECHLFDRVLRGAAPTIISKPLSSLTVKKASSFSSKVIVLSGALQVHIYPGAGDDFPGSLWAALSPNYWTSRPAGRVFCQTANTASAQCAG